METGPGPVTRRTNNPATNETGTCMPPPSAGANPLLISTMKIARSIAYRLAELRTGMVRKPNAIEASRRRTSEASRTNRSVRGMEVLTRPLQSRRTFCRRELEIMGNSVCAIDSQGTFRDQRLGPDRCDSTCESQLANALHAGKPVPARACLSRGAAACFGVCPASRFRAGNHVSRCKQTARFVPRWMSIRHPPWDKVFGSASSLVMSVFPHWHQAPG